MNEVVNKHGVRQDGRRLTEIRRLKCIVNEGVQRGVDGSVYFEQGQNKLIVSIIGPVPSSSSVASSGNGLGSQVSCNFRLSPYSSQDRRKRGKSDRFCIESGAMISKTFSSVICDLSSRSQVIINITVLENDGSIRSAAINATSIALAVSGVSMKDLVVSATCGLYGEQILHDLTLSEMDSLKGTFLMAINSTDEEVSPVTIDLNTRLDTGVIESLMVETFAACKQFSAEIRRFLRNYTRVKYQKMYSK